MTSFDDREFIRPYPRPFPMHALQYFSAQDLNSAQRKAIANLLLDYYMKCAQEEEKLIAGMIREINNLESKV
ncbi:MAG: hypothetical protein QUS66_13640 [Bacteroidota bacterium]|jgi:hypothetical protein|nr:hypothetical protein [Bacteroidota bacterium]